MYERIQRKQKQVPDDERLIKVDVPRTFPDEPFFAAVKPEVKSSLNNNNALSEDDVVVDAASNLGEGQQVLSRLLLTLVKHSSSIGYIQGLNYIVASLYYHCGEVLAFELTIRALNDYHLKEV